MSQGSEPAERPDRHAGQPRKGSRVEVEAEVLVRRTSRHNYLVRLFDISQHGCKVEFVERPTLDERIFIKIEGLDGLEGVVRWTKGSVVGVDFTRPLHDAVFEHVVKRLR